MCKIKSNHDLGWKALQQSGKRFLEWAKYQRLGVVHLEFVATFESFADRSEIYIFFETNAILAENKKNHQLVAIENHFNALLIETHYPSEKWPVVYYYDTHENVVKYYGGKYFNRLR